MTDSTVDMCLASVHFYPAYSGPAVRFRRYAPGLRQRGVNMRVFTAVPDKAEQVSKAEERTPEDDWGHGALLPLSYVGDIPVQHVRIPLGHALLARTVYSYALVDYCRRDAHRPDVVQFLSLSLWAVPWLSALRRGGIPLVLTHTLLGELSPKLWKRRLQRLYWRLPFQLVDCVVVSSGVMRAALHNIGVTTRIEVIPNGVDAHRFQPATSLGKRKALRRELGLHPEAEVILFVGPLNPRKGVDVLVEAWCLLARQRPRAHLVLVGPDYREILRGLAGGAFEARLRATIAGAGAPQRVIFAGLVDNVEAYYQTADVFVLPSRREGMPNSVAEAFSCGLASILTPFIGLPAEFGRPGEQYVLVERTPEALAAAIIALLDNPGLRQELGCQSRRWVETYLDVENSLDQYAALYFELVGRLRREDESGLAS